MRLPSDTEVVEKEDLVFTVSAKEYWNPTVLTIEETGEGLAVCLLQALLPVHPFPFVEGKQ